jgi:hypothetical protein
MAEPVPQNVVDRLTTLLFEDLVEDERYDLIPPGQARGFLSSLVRSDRNLAKTPTELLQEVGRYFSADAVMAGYVFRWKERVGTNYSVSKPASVAFDLQLIRPTDGAMLWRSKFDMTQKPLSENILDIGTFFRAGGRWLTVDELARIGLNQLISELPLKEGL